MIRYESTQQEIDFAKAARDNGIQQAIDHADEVNPSWSEQAYYALKCFLDDGQGEFLCEEFRQWCEINELIPSPPHNRAYGAVMVRAVKEGLIISMGYAPVTNSKAHRTPATVWKRV